MEYGAGSYSPLAAGCAKMHAKTRSNKEKRGILMNRLLVKAGGLALLFALIPLMAPGAAAQTDQITANQATNTETEKEKQDDAKKRSKLMKTHFASGNQAMQNAQAIRQRLQTATNDQRGPSRRTRNTCSWSQAGRMWDKCKRRWTGLQN